MGDRSGIEWTEATWNPLRGCSRVSEGCRNCYAEAVASRFSGEGMPYEGLAKNGKWTGKLRFVEEALDQPLRWTKPRRIFVNSMSDLFHENVPNAWIDRIFAVMAATTGHTFQILTKRPERMLDYCRDGARHAEAAKALHTAGRWPERLKFQIVWPLPNVWLGVSVEDQKTADERIPLLLQTQAAVRWVSYEPALGPVYFGACLFDGRSCLCACHAGAGIVEHDRPCCSLASLDWIVVGGESGPGARPFNVEWARSVIVQGGLAGVPVFVKQLGAWPMARALAEVGDLKVRPSTPLERGGGAEYRILLKDRKGGDMSEWPEDLRVREYPGIKTPDCSPFFGRPLPA